MIDALLVLLYWSRKAKNLGLDGVKYGGKAFVIYLLCSIAFGVMAYASGAIGIAIISIPIGLSLTYFIISRDIQEAISNGDASIITDKKLIYTTDIADKYRSSSEHKYKYVDKLTSKMIEHNRSVKALGNDSS